MNAILGQKKGQGQTFLENGQRIPVTKIWVQGNIVVAVKTPEKHNYSSVQLGFGTKKNPHKALSGITKGAQLKNAPYFLREVRLADGDSAPEIGSTINVADIFKPGDIVDVTGISKGKGWAGVVKRHHFKGGPRTHGQSDRERAPGSIGQTTTPGRVYKGKRMAGRMGQDTVTLQNLQVVAVSPDEVLVKGLVPGAVGANSILIIKKVGEDKKFVAPFTDKTDAASVEDSGEPREEVQTAAEPVSETVETEQAPVAEVAENKTEEVAEEQQEESK